MRKGIYIMKYLMYDKIKHYNIHGKALTHKEILDYINEIFRLGIEIVDIQLKN